LHSLLAQLSSRPSVAGIPNVDIQGIAEDSRLVRPGTLFIARSGTKTDGARYLADAQANGAVAAIVSAPVAGLTLPQVVLPDPASAVSPLAHALYGHPTRALDVVGITGTNGKTTTTYILRHLLAKAALRCGMIGTVEI